MSFTPPAAPVPRGRNTTRTILIIAGVLLSLCCVLGIVGGILFFRTVGNEIGPAWDAASAYVDDVIDANYSSAYGRMCDKVRQRVSVTEYTTNQATLKIASYRVIGTNIKTMNTTVMATVTMRMKQAATGLEVTQIIPLTRERGEWHVCE